VSGKVLVANHAGIRVLAISGIPNICIDEPRALVKVSHDEVKHEMQAKVVPKVVAIVRGLVKALEGGGDISIDLDDEELRRFQVPTRLCVPWHEVFLTAALGIGAVALLAFPSVRSGLAGEIRRYWRRV
jgi:hypothetical protein